MKHIHAPSLLFIDVEATRHDLIEFAAARVAPDGGVTTFQTLVNPRIREPRSFHYWQTHVHGIRQEDLVGAPTFAELAPQLTERFRGAILVAHNASYDRRVLQREFHRLGQPFTPPMLCTLRLARARWPGLPSYTLSALCRELDIERGRAHRALPDAMATLALFMKMLPLEVAS